MKKTDIASLADVTARVAAIRAAYECADRTARLTCAQIEAKFTLKSGELRRLRLQHSWTPRAGSRGAARAASPGGRGGRAQVGATKSVTASGGSADQPAGGAVASTASCEKDAVGSSAVASPTSAPTVANLERRLRLIEQLEADILRRFETLPHEADPRDVASLVRSFQSLVTAGEAARARLVAERAQTDDDGDDSVNADQLRAALAQRIRTFVTERAAEAGQTRDFGAHSHAVDVDGGASKSAD